MLTSVAVSVGLVLGGIVLLESLGEGQQPDGLQDATSSSFADTLREQGAMDKLEEYAVVFMIILTSTASVFLLLTWHNLSHYDSSEESLSCPSAVAVSQERETWSSACCCYMTPGDTNGIKTYLITLKGEMDGNSCAQLQMTIQTSKDLDNETLAKLEEIIIETLNKADNKSPQSLLEVVYTAAMDYLRHQNLLDE